MRDDMTPKQHALSHGRAKEAGGRNKARHHLSVCSMALIPLDSDPLDCWTSLSEMRTKFLLRETLHWSWTKVLILQGLKNYMKKL